MALMCARKPRQDNLPRPSVLKSKATRSFMSFWMTSRLRWSGCSTRKRSRNSLDERKFARSSPFPRSERSPALQSSTARSFGARMFVAAIACLRRNLSPVDLLEIADQEIRAFGTAVATPGGYPVARANGLHRSLPWEQATLNALADHLQALGRPAVRHARTQVKAAVAELAIEEVDAGPHREWLTSLTSAP